MSVTRDKKTWRCQFYYEDWQGKRHRKNKRGFQTKKEAQEWERNFLQQRQRNLEITFENFVAIYLNDMQNRLRQSTMRNKRFLFDRRITPYFKAKKMCEIKTVDIREWQNVLIRQSYSQTYLKTINNQLSALFNYAARYYDLRDNPCRRAGSIGKCQPAKVNFWTQEEFDRFLTAMERKQAVRLAFLILYWTGMRIGELLALCYGDIDFSGKTISITKSCQRIDGQNLITPPKTPKSNRKVSIPDFLEKEIREYCQSGKINTSATFLFHFTKSYMEHEIIRGARAAGIKRIRLHDLRHSHASLLVEMGFQPLLIAERLGHEKIETTLNTYSHLYPNKQAQLADRLDMRYRENSV